MPEDGVPAFQHKDILSYEEIRDITAYLVSKGVDKVRLTGGEPLVRRDIHVLVRMLSQISGIRDLSMTTNGILLDKYAQLLADSGLQRVNVSLDSLDQQKYHKITRRGHLKDVLRGIQAAEEAGLQPIKINMVINQYSTLADRKELQAFADRKGYSLRFIHEMQLNSGTFTRVEGGEGGNCAACNRIRLTADGKLKPCLFSSLAYDVRELGIKNALKLSLENKPGAGSVNTHEHFSQIGG